MASKKTQIKYLECKSAGGHCGGARICRVHFSKSGRTIYYRGLRLIRSTQAIQGNYVDENSRLEYWVSGPKRNGQDRHWAGGGVVRVDADCVEQYWRGIRRSAIPADPFVT